ncbi:DUF4261 domain-containing protein [Fulvivirga maritima]|uniref:DUF4261 domain-containing protein n=1 Tax=Fulvivirga maritima TaxID=2904247 RepID=UPI001F47CCA8|nr:DUF4261 domain-containing protein [Fulvivirga maritima]UII28314.1 DUF4261 domain-containing protein [Fulvivirga maritima]
MTTENKSRSMLCIPGKWQSREEILSAITTSNMNEFIFAGNVLLNLKTNEAFEVEIYEKDSYMKNSFRYTGMINGLSDEFLNEIDEHNLTIYLSTEIGDLEKAKGLALAGNAILKAGGIGVKVESTGISFTKEQWSQSINNLEATTLYHMFVLPTITNGPDITYTCGMHNLGLKDCIVYNETFHDAAQLIFIFNYYQLLEKPEITIGQTFSTVADAPVFLITEEEQQPNLGDELFENPYGMWKLMRKENATR